jgi:hypothetical protein
VCAPLRHKPGASITRRIHRSILLITRARAIFAVTPLGVPSHGPARPATPLHTHSTSPSLPQVAEEAAEEAPQSDVYTSADDDEETCCETCGDHRRSKQLLLCDGCPRAFHTFCLSPPVLHVPAGDWFCPVCLPCNADQNLMLACPLSPELLLEARRKSSIGRMRASFYLGRRSLGGSVAEAPAGSSKRSLETHADAHAGGARVSGGGGGSGRETTAASAARIMMGTIEEEGEPRGSLGDAKSSRWVTLRALAG